MIVKLSEIEDNVVVNGRVESSRFSSLGDNRFSPCSPVEFALTVKKLGNGYRVSGPIECVMAMTEMVQYIRTVT